MIPASNQKLFVTAALLADLGPTARLETRVYARGKLGGRGDSVVGGDLVLVGDGDPSCGTGRFARANDQPATRVSQLARNVAAAGVKRVEGRILADDSIFDRERRAGPDLSPLSGLSFNNGYDGGDYAQSPELIAAKGLKSALRKRGVRVDGQVGRANLPAATLESEPLAAVASPTVAKLIEETNVPSNNFFAEMLLKRLAATSGRKGTRHRGNDKVETFAASIVARSAPTSGAAQVPVRHRPRCAWASTAGCRARGTWLIGRRRTGRGVYDRSGRRRKRSSSGSASTSGGGPAAIVHRIARHRSPVVVVSPVVPQGGGRLRRGWLGRVEA